ncbi:hypothetical protein [Hyphococcus luteus]|uniref:Glycosyltransferase RgtA/B/C/D-like domain-containing protein n=1 Tax=Hyphococcus luteus TaxID=2058213 RepID=A0A2S7K480_9PROT|nr:hypothetical protein [Marinicaulis flavus]PQA87307.1 hypothetical protein CW354_12810 [Marinicaulis flavus]
MNTTAAGETIEPEFAWRAGAPRARSMAMRLFSWRQPGWVFLWSVGAASLFVAAALLSPALLSLSPTVDMIGPIAEARAVMAGEADLAAQDAPFHLLLLMAADIFVDAPGRVHLVAKAIGAALVAYAFAFIAITRFPAVFVTLATAALAGFIAAPFSGAPEFGLALFIVCGLCFLTASADDSPGRARFEGALAGLMLAALWLLHPAFALIGFILLSACPFLTGRAGLWRYAGALIGFAFAAGLMEVMAPGVNLARAGAAPGALELHALFKGGESAVGLGGAAYGALIVILSSAVFGGGAHWKNWAASAALMVAGLIAAKLAGASALPVFAFAAALACFSVSSPFYDGLFREHDRASVATALTAAALTLFWTGAVAVHAAGQFSLQHRAAKEAPENIRSELALVQPGGPTIAKWVEEGRFSTPEARAFFALTPVDQSAMLLEAAARARVIAAEGLDVAFLTGADTACVLAEERDCRADGPAAANEASVVFVPRLEMDPKTTEAKGRAEAMLYTQFKMVERTALWEIWVRRDAPAPAGLFPSTATDYR